MLHESDVGVVIPSLLKATRDDFMKVRLLVFRCLACLCETVAGAKAMIKYNGVQQLLRFLEIRGEEGYTGSDDDEACTYALRAIASCCSLQDGLTACINLSDSIGKKSHGGKFPSSAIDLSVQIILAENAVPAVAGGALSARAAEASRTLSIISFSEVARDIAINTGAVEALISLLLRLRELSRNTVGEKRHSTTSLETLSEAKLSTTNALAALTASDEAKLRFFPCDQSLDVLCSQLSSNESAIRLASLKVVGNVAVYPAARSALRQVYKFHLNHR